MTVKDIFLASAIAAAVAATAIPGASRSGPSREGSVQAVHGEGATARFGTPAARLVTHTVRSGAERRAYAAYVPGSRDVGRPASVVVDIHGSGSHPAEELSISGLAAAAEERGFVVLLPIAVVPLPTGGATWNVPPDPELPDDDRYLLDLLEDASKRYGLDASRVFVAGFSGGARLGSEFASRHADRVAALAAVGGLREPGGDGLPVPILAFHGTADPVNPYAGGGPSYWGYGVERAWAGWVERDRCGGEAVVTRSPSSGARTRKRKDGVAEVTLYRFDGGHVWPGTSFPFPVERFGPTPHDIDATMLIIEFFERYGLPAATTSAPSETSEPDRVDGAGRLAEPSGLGRPPSFADPRRSIPVSMTSPAGEERHEVAHVADDARRAEDHVRSCSASS